MKRTRIQFKQLGQALNHSLYYGGWIATNYFTHAFGDLHFWYSFDYTPSEIMSDRHGDMEIGLRSYFEGKIKQ